MPKLRIENFKCYKKEELLFGDLTVLVGANGAGKSSVIQSLLLLHEAVQAPKEHRRLPMNGFRSQNLGSASDIVFNNDISLDIKLSWVVDKPLKSSRVTLRSPDGDVIFNIDKIKCSIGENELTKAEFHFISADRIGSSIAQPMHSSGNLNVGDKGEYCAQLLADTYSHKVNSSRLYDNNTSPFLLDQVNLYIKDLFPGVEIVANSSEEMQTAQVQMRNSVHSEFGLSTNVGYGISYLLPIIVVGLMADKGSMMIVENPEAHLHPSAQSQIGKFLAMVAATGTRVVIETHSDHLVNGIQYYALSHGKFLPNVIINNFSIASKAESHKRYIKIDRIKLEGNGDYSCWPIGFMDQNKKDLYELYNLRRSIHNNRNM